MPFNLSPSRGFDTSARARFTNKACRINRSKDQCAQRVLTPCRVLDCHLGDGQPSDCGRHLRENRGAGRGWLGALVGFAKERKKCGTACRATATGKMGCGRNCQGILHTVLLKKVVDQHLLTPKLFQLSSTETVTQTAVRFASHKRFQPREVSGESSCSIGSCAQPLRTAP